MNRSVRKILVANRGEIAVRILRACEEMGYRTVTVFSEADRKSLHVRYADEAFCIGPPPSQESYLRIDRIIDAAKRSGADGIHPGYGFLAENADMAEACVKAGLVWIGPSGRVIRAMGDKIFARHAVRKVGVPVVPGAQGEITDMEEAVRTAGKIGYPVLIKAAAGGGGKGMRIVGKEDGLRDAVTRARSEARGAFGSEVVYIEKYLEKPRHIEFQILADNCGNIIHLGERECSIQRRHQKLIEESPSPIVTGAMREEMGRNAIKAMNCSVDVVKQTASRGGPGRDIVLLMFFHGVGGLWGVTESWSASLRVDVADNLINRAPMTALIIHRPRQPKWLIIRGETRIIVAAPAGI